MVVRFRLVKIVVVGGLAQMVERSLSMREALGSMPRFSISSDFGNQSFLRLKFMKHQNMTVPGSIPDLGVERNSFVSIKVISKPLNMFFEGCLPI